MACRKCGKNRKNKKKALPDGTERKYICPVCGNLKVVARTIYEAWCDECDAYFELKNGLVTRWYSAKQLGIVEEKNG